MRRGRGAVAHTGLRWVPRKKTGRREGSIRIPISALRLPRSLRMLLFATTTKELLLVARGNVKQIAETCNSLMLNILVRS
jgi:hypothetical protein